MRQTWRWFGPADEISISEIRQTGAAGIVSALHHLPSGAVWSVPEIERRRSEIEGGPSTPSGLAWDVVRMPQGRTRVGETPAATGPATTA